MLQILPAILTNALRDSAGCSIFGEGDAFIGVRATFSSTVGDKGVTLAQWTCVTFLG